MTTIPIASYSIPAGFGGMLRKDFNYYVSKGDILHALSKVRNRKDIVTLVTKHQLTSSYVAEQAKLGNGTDLIYNILENAGVAWAAAYFSRLTPEQLDALPIPKKYIDYYVNTHNTHDLNHDWYIVSAIHQNILAIHSMDITPYMFLVIYGISCDTSMVTEYIKTASPDYFLRDDIRKVCNIFIEKYGTDDPISLLLQNALSNKRKIVMKYDRIQSYTNQLGGVYTFYHDGSITYAGKSRRKFPTNNGDIVSSNYLGVYVNDCLFLNRGDNTLEYRGETYKCTSEGPIVTFTPELTDKMKLGAEGSATYFPIYGLDLYHLISDIKQLGYDNRSINDGTALIPQVLYDLVNEVVSYEYWGRQRLIFYSDGYVDGNNTNVISTLESFPTTIIAKGIRHILYSYNIGSDYFVNFDHYVLRSSANLYRFVADGTNFVLNAFGEIDTE